MLQISIHALPAEGDKRVYRCLSPGNIFQSTPSPRRATLIVAGVFHTSEFQSTPSPRRATDTQTIIGKLDGVFQSTPSPRRATETPYYFFEDFEFQSTPSPRRATFFYKKRVDLIGISIHALPAEGDPVPSVVEGSSLYISIHALPAEGDPCVSSAASPSRRFQSTPSPRRATTLSRSSRVWRHYFNPRPPRGGRPKPKSYSLFLAAFQSTPSPRRATRKRR